MRAAALATLAILLVPAAAQARRYDPPNPPEGLFLEAYAALMKLKPSERQCDRRLPRKYILALNGRCLLFNGATHPICGYGDCGTLISQMQLWCNADDAPGEIPCSEQANRIRFKKFETKPDE